MSQNLTRDEKIENLVMNHTMIFMAMFEEAFTTLAEQMATTMAAGASAMAEALGEKPPSDSGIAEKTKLEVAPEVRAGLGKAFSEMRKDMASQWPKDNKQLKEYISNPAFDKATRIVERQDFGLPKLTEKLDDGTLASYVVLLKNNDERLGTMFKELGELMNSLPRPPWAKDS